MSLGQFVRTVGDVTVTIVTDTGAIDSISSIDVAGSGYVIGDLLTFADDGNGDGVLEVLGVNASGGVTSFGIDTPGTGYADGQITYDGTTLVGAPVGYYDHNQYEAGGVISEYTTYPNGPLTDGKPSSYTPQGSFAAYDTEDIPTVKVVRPADKPQLVVPRWEPTIVDGNNNIVGNTIRAEDIYDEDRCVAANFVWTTANTNQGLGDYGYCVNPTPAFDAGLPQVECEAAGYLYDNISNVCVDPTVVNSGAATQTYAATTMGYDVRGQEAICTSFGYYWNGTTCGAFPADFSTFVTQASCVAAKGIWIAGTCYSPVDFGNGQGGDFKDKVGSHNLTP